MAFQSLEQIKRRAAAAGSEFFTLAQVEYWQSQVHGVVYPINYGGVFITSEPGAFGEDRRYTVRVATEAPGKRFGIHTVGEFRAYAALADAQAAADKYAAIHR